MREILFRGKCIGDNGEWLYGSYLPKSKTICTETIITGTTQYADVFVDPETVGQYTGLTDRNGKKIFEGDIVNMHGGCEEMGAREYDIRCKVVYGRKGYGAEIGFTGAYNSGMQTPLMCEGALTVIGNIHDNPELLEGKQ